MEDAGAELLAFYGLPAEHWSKLRSTNPLERGNREIGRRTDVVGILPNDTALLRLAGMLLLEQDDSGWSAAATCRSRPRPWWLAPGPRTNPPDSTSKRCPSSLLP